MKRFTLVWSVLAAGCSWSTFDDLSNSTWAHAEEKPDNNETDYGLAVVGATTDTPGRIGVLGNGPPTYSTIEITADGTTSSANSDLLSNHSIDALSTRPILIGDGAGNVAVVDLGVDGAIVVVHGPATQLVEMQAGTSQPPDSAIFSTGGNILVAATAAASPAGLPNLFVVGPSGGSCLLVDGAAAPVAFAAIAADSTNLFAWTRTGVVLKFLLSQIIGCGATTPTISPVAGTFTSPTMPMTNGAQIDLIGDPAKFAVLSAFDSNSTVSTPIGQVAVVDLSSFAQVGTPVSAMGAHTAVLGTLGSSEVLALGFPTRAVGGTTAAGAVELHTVDATTGVVDADASDVLSIPQASANAAFGRALAITKFNGQEILVVGATSVVYTYFQTSLYGNTRQ